MKNIENINTILDDSPDDSNETSYLPKSSDNNTKSNTSNNEYTSTDNDIYNTNNHFNYNTSIYSISTRANISAIDNNYTNTHSKICIYT